jgi:hypothetical protein
MIPLIASAAPASPHLPTRLNALWPSRKSDAIWHEKAGAHIKDRRRILLKRGQPSMHQSAHWRR